MPNYCVAPGCTSGSNAEQINKNSRLSTFHFPKDETRRRMWESQVSSGLKATNNSFL